ncbi:hypothetical protein [Flavobacterium denitrificans]|uniref:hypothetical protein n=1 Tax=Flavobacterium denitrificans TaxID=281361 RepID=UPI0003F73C28|nr:hypothetical protein [Flavobacterium denitrificans]
MKKIFLIIILSFGPINAQISTKIEGVIINAPCELEYTRNIGNQNNYSCPLQYDVDKIDNYSITVSNLQTQMNGLKESSLKEFKASFLKTIEINSKAEGESIKYLKLKNGIDALSSISYLTYGTQKFKNISITFLYKQKSFIVNITTNNLKKHNEIAELSERIIFN